MNICLNKMKNQEYIDIEKLELENLEEKLTKFKGKWFKVESVKQEIEFLQFYIKQKQNLINQISHKLDKTKNGT